jgi:hypothetical protein
MAASWAIAPQGRFGKLVIPDQLIQLKGVADGMHDSVL